MSHGSKFRSGAPVEWKKNCSLNQEQIFSAQYFLSAKIFLSIKATFADKTATMVLEYFSSSKKAISCLLSTE
jgi:hypothetical protein